jgi:preprotein translocase subunit SecY
MKTLFYKIPEIRNKILFTLFIILVFRILSHIPVPNVDIAAIKAFIQNNQLLGLFDLFSGGGLKNFSIVTLGLAPYINASIIVQLFTTIVPSLEELSKEGEYGREKINQYTKFLTFPISLVQSFGFYSLLKSQGVAPQLNFLDTATVVAAMVAGTYILMWVGDLVTEHGLGNGISLLIFVGIVSTLPESIYRFIYLLTPETIFSALVFGAATLAIVAGVVLINEGVKNIPLEYGRRMASGGSRVSSSLPLKVNQVGVIPVIFAASIVLIPSFLGSYLITSPNNMFRDLGYFLNTNFQSTSFLYNLVMFLFVIAFTYFYTSIQFNPEKISEDVKKRGGFIPGIRPGLNTTNHLKGVINKITLGGGVFLGMIAVLPYIVHSFIGFSSFALGGTSLLIIVSVVLETIRKMDSLMVSKKYDSFLD